MFDWMILNNFECYSEVGRPRTNLQTTRGNFFGFRNITLKASTLEICAVLEYPSFGHQKGQEKQDKFFFLKGFYEDSQSFCFFKKGSGKV